MDGLKKLDNAELAGSDSFTTSESEELEISKYKKTTKALPDIRKERIAELRRQIECGEYRIDSKAIAEKILNRNLSENPF